MGAIPSAVRLENFLNSQTSRALRHRNSTSHVKALNQTAIFATKRLIKEINLEATLQNWRRSNATPISQKGELKQIILSRSRLRVRGR